MKGLPSAGRMNDHEQGVQIPFRRDPAGERFCRTLVISYPTLHPSLT